MAVAIAEAAAANGSCTHQQSSSGGSSSVFERLATSMIDLHPSPCVTGPRQLWYNRIQVYAPHSFFTSIVLPPAPPPSHPRPRAQDRAEWHGPAGL
jgi:hypothetical protein